MAACGKNGLDVYYGSKSGTFTNEFLSTTTTASKVAIGDVNDDGLLDCVTSSNGGSSFTFLQKVDESFALEGVSAHVLPPLTDIALFHGDEDNAADIAYSALLGFPGVELHVSTAINTEEVTTTKYMNLMTQEGARDALDSLNRVIDRVNSERGAVGALQSKLMTQADNLGAVSIAYGESIGRIRDVDVAGASAEMARHNVAQQAAVSIVAQANQQPSIVMSLLR